MLHEDVINVIGVWFIGLWVCEVIEQRIECSWNENVKIGVVPDAEKIRESRLRWVINALVRKSDLIRVEGMERGKGRLEITLVEVA